MLFRSIYAGLMFGDIKDNFEEALDDDLSVVNHFADDIAVMYLGQLIEKAPSEQLFDKPTHPYTQALLSAIPVPSLKKKLKIN